MEQIWRSFLSADIGLPMIASLLTGVLIGLEREARGKAAGLRTHALVCFASTLVMLASARQAEWHVEFLPGGTIVADPARMAHGVLTGIGFLCAGVIFREGASVRGLTTAASLWATASIGLLYGVGLYWLAVSGTILTLLVLSLLRLIQSLMPQRIEARLVVVTQTSGGLSADGLREILSARNLRVGAMAWDSTGSTGHLELSVRTWFSDEHQADELAAQIAATPGVIGFAIIPARDDGSAIT
ncbi:MgtC/SapB family protein [Amaricoccus sp. W119]|uniref:MgtC/SapB family protein n=1 Tax=Amaricoccus sp. W119 TaxID=3391833 RepID=UPI0039A6EAAB